MTFLNCVVICGLVMAVSKGLDVDHHGNFFMLAFMETYSEHSKNQIIITTQHDVDIEIKIPFLNQTLQYHLPAVSSQHVNLDYTTSVTSENIAETKAISVLSSSPVSVYGLSLEANSSDGYLAIPVKALFTNYIVYSYHEDGVIGQIGLIGIENQTTVKVKFTAGSKCYLSNSALYNNLEIVFNYLKTHRFNEYQVLRITCETDITGIVVTSDKPIAVLTGHVCGSVHEITCDHLVEMAEPSNVHGKSYVLMPSMNVGSGSNSTFRIVHGGSLATINLMFSSGYTDTLYPGTFVDIPFSEPVCLQSSSNILVIEVMHSASTGSPVGDPFISTVPPTDMFTSSYTLDSSVVSNGKQFQSYISIIASAHTMQRLDFVNNFNNISDCEFATATLPVHGQLINLESSSDMSFGMMTYGVLVAESYGFPVGMKFKDYTGIDECESNTTCPNGDVCVQIGSSYRCYSLTKTPTDTTTQTPTDTTTQASTDTTTQTPTETTTQAATDTTTQTPTDTTTQEPVDATTQETGIPTQQVDTSISTTLIPGVNPSIPGLTSLPGVELTLNTTVPSEISVPEVNSTLPYVNISVPMISLPAELPPTLPTPSCICACPCLPRNRSMDDIIEEVKELQDELTVEHEILSANVRKKISVVDERPSASSIGYIGVVVLSLVFGSIIALDLFTCAMPKRAKKSKT
ncbi:IgGFc-binding protein [Patella vulgata]|uniref:IgGFc-binding protein n=1 Tax=Patella vulgata TaxID=6465 RepID=UPI00217FCC10|nr:IgGFc-binding protein [Patella vulgata]XP_050417168.1 IgGFc-binding protein [Patella vulgata]